MDKSVLLATGILVSWAALADDNPAIEAMREYMEFAEYSGGSISTDQLASIDTKDIFSLIPEAGDSLTQGISRAL